MTEPDSQGEWFADVCRAEFGRNNQVVQAYLDRHHQKELASERTPNEIIRRELLASFRRGASEFMRVAVWNFLEAERKRRGLSQQQLADKAGVSQPTYSKIRTAESGFESIMLFLRGLEIPLGALPAPLAVEVTIEGLLRAIRFLTTEVFRKSHQADLSREDAEWLLHMDASPPWLEVLQTQDEPSGQVVAACLAVSVSLRLGRKVATREFSDLLEFWKTWSGEWEICMTAISAVIGKVSGRGLESE